MAIESTERGVGSSATIDGKDAEILQPERKGSRSSSRSKEDIAAHLRDVLDVDVKFEKLTVKELEALDEKLSTPASLAQLALNAGKLKVTETVEAQSQGSGPLGFGIVPSIVNRARERFFGGEATQ